MVIQLRDPINMQPANKGFTLIELLVTLSVLAIVMSIAAPSFQQQIKNNKSITLTDEFVSALNFVRIEAVRRAHRVSLCPSIDGTSCAGNDDWDKGWIAFVDTADSDDQDTAELDLVNFPILRYWKMGAAGTQIILPTAEKVFAEEKVKTGVELTVPAVSAINFVRFTSLGTLAKVSNNSSMAFIVNMAGCNGFNKSIVMVGVAGLITTTYVDCI